MITVLVISNYSNKKKQEYSEVKENGNRYMEDTKKKDGETIAY